MTENPEEEKAMEGATAEEPPAPEPSAPREPGRPEWGGLGIRWPWKRGSK